MKKKLTFYCVDLEDKLGDDAKNNSVILNLLDQYVTLRRFGKGSVTVEFDSDTKEVRMIAKAEKGSTKITFVDYEDYV